MSYTLDIVNLFVRDIQREKTFWTETLGLPLVEEMSSAGFVALRPAGGSLVTLQDVETLGPGAPKQPGGCELGLEVADVDAVWRDWRAKGVELLTDPLDLPFGRTFLARAPEGHLLRVYRLAR